MFGEMGVHVLSGFGVHLQLRRAKIWFWAFPTVGKQQRWVESLQGRDMPNKDTPVSVNHADLVGGFNPFEKYARQIGSFPQVGVKIKNIWNHQPVILLMLLKSVLLPPSRLGILTSTKQPYLLMGTFGGITYCWWFRNPGCHLGWC